MKAQRTKDQAYVMPGAPATRGAGTGAEWLKPSNRSETLRFTRAKRRGSARTDGLAEPRRRAYSNRVPRSAGSGSVEFAMTSPLIAMVGVPMPEAPGATGVLAVIVVT